ncbi:uncharacterized protein PHACADRAFT_263857 [Phanerochaete carnosa HHB-10118-sp]|uniref:Uncharacterized protein n=1 Tax=Phanerochaete carnosa (strain HHB-10118-sp) TaxID=650164 RepID=K5VH16_PHACS|nr:uncharacterized protein PHACADRAFT_263857 [Phanerochaete carnosa HHB-10118-sp]EKM50518.1 hypothetical protein PHACADRAFT_263857 [Phanerochaete carnosa HHB-10118-sp]
MSSQAQAVPTAMSATGLRHLATIEYSDLFTILATTDRARFPEARSAYSLKTAPANAPPLAPSSPRSRRLLGRGSKGSLPSDDEATLVNDELEQLLKLGKEKQASVAAEIKLIDAKKHRQPSAASVSRQRSPAPSPLRDSVPQPKPQTDTAPEPAVTERDQVFSHYVAKIREHYTIESFRDTICDILEESQKGYRPLAEGMPAPVPSVSVSVVVCEDTENGGTTAFSSSYSEEPEAQSYVAPKRLCISGPLPEPNQGGTAAEKFNRKQLLLDLVACALPHKTSPQWKKVKLNLGKPKAWLRAATSRKRELSDVD